MQSASSEQDSDATLAVLLQMDRRVPSVQSNILAAKAELTSDKTLPLDNRSLFDTVPLLDPFVAPTRDFKRLP